MLYHTRPLAARRILAAAMLGLVAATTAVAGTFTGRVVGVADGDTVTVLVDGNTQVKVRLNGIDAPEKSQAFGNRAKQFTSEQCFGQTVTVDDQGVDKYGRTVGEVILADGTNLNVALVENGFAWWYRKYGLNKARYAHAEARARAARRGLWSDPHAIPPWEFRQRQYHPENPHAEGVTDLPDDDARHAMLLAERDRDAERQIEAIRQYGLAVRELKLREAIALRELKLREQIALASLTAPVVHEDESQWLATGKRFSIRTSVLLAGLVTLVTVFFWMARCLDRSDRRQQEQKRELQQRTTERLVE